MKVTIVAVVGDALLAVLVPDDVGARQRDLGRDADVGEAVVEEAEVVEHVLAGLAAVHVHAQAGGARRELLGQLQLGVHRVLSCLRSMGLGSRRERRPVVAGDSLGGSGGSGPGSRGRALVGRASGQWLASIAAGILEVAVAGPS